VTLPAEPTDPAIDQANSPVVTSQTLNADKSVSMTIEVAGIKDIPSTSTVSVYTVTDGRSTTAVGLAQGQSTVTINDLPQDQNITVKTVIRDTLTNTQTQSLQLLPQLRQHQLQLEVLQQIAQLFLLHLFFLEL
jgi:hypothetical protein